MVLVISSKIWAIEKTPGGIIILNMSTINENHMVYDSWDMEHNRQNFFSFWTIFCTFTPASVTTQRCKMKKTPGDIIILHKCTINDNHMIYGSWDMKFTRQNVFVILGHFLPFYHITAQQPKKNTRIYHHFIQVYQKSWLYAILFLRFGTWQM